MTPGVDHGHPFLLKVGVIDYWVYHIKNDGLLSNCCAFLRLLLQMICDHSGVSSPCQVPKVEIQELMWQPARCYPKLLPGKMMINQCTQTQVHRTWQCCSEKHQCCAGCNIR